MSPSLHRNVELQLLSLTPRKPMFKQERKLDEKLPLLFADKKYAASEVQVSTTGVLNGAASSKEDGAMSSSTVAVASPSGMILEQKPQTGVTGPRSDPEEEALVVTIKSSDDEPSPTSVSRHSITFFSYPSQHPPSECKDACREGMYATIFS